MFNNTVDDLPSVNGHSELAAIPKRANASRDCGQVMLNITYINHMGYPITVVTRQGFRHVVNVRDVQHHWTTVPRSIRSFRNSSEF
jgi:hypothetical protein